METQQYAANKSISEIADGIPNAIHTPWRNIASLAAILFPTYAWSMPCTGVSTAYFPLPQEIIAQNIDNIPVNGVVKSSSTVQAGTPAP